MVDFCLLLGQMFNVLSSVRGPVLAVAGMGQMFNVLSSSVRGQYLLWLVWDRCLMSCPPLLEVSTCCGWYGTDV